MSLFRHANLKLGIPVLSVLDETSFPGNQCPISDASVQSWQKFLRNAKLSVKFTHRIVIQQTTTTSDQPDKNIFGGSVTDSGSAEKNWRFELHPTDPKCLSVGLSNGPWFQSLFVKHRKTPEASVEITRTATSNDPQYPTPGVSHFQQQYVTAYRGPGIGGYYYLFRQAGDIYFGMYFSYGYSLSGDSPVYMAVQFFTGDYSIWKRHKRLPNLKRKYKLGNPGDHSKIIVTPDAQDNIVSAMGVQINARPYRLSQPNDGYRHPNISYSGGLTQTVENLKVKFVL